VALDMKVDISTTGNIAQEEVVLLYRANGWSSADKPKELMSALRNSHTLLTARASGKLLGVGNAISDGHLVVYYPHLLVHPDYHGQGIGRKMMQKMHEIYGGFHQQMLTADGDAIHFYEALGFERAGKTEPMWIYAGNEH